MGNEMPQVWRKPRLVSVNYDAVFEKAIDRLHAEGRYRVFIDILRNKGSYQCSVLAGHNGPRKSLCGVRTIISAWDSIPR